MRKIALGLALAAVAAPSGAQAPVPPGAAPRAALPAGSSTAAPAARAPKEPVLRGTVLEEVAGKVAEIDRRAHRLRIETASGPVTLSLDRNTMVYTATGLGTVLDLAPGVQVRAGRNADFLAYWVQVRAPPSAASAPGQGTGSAAGSAPAGEGAGPGASAAPAPPTTGPSAGPGGPGPVSGSPAPR